MIDAHGRRISYIRISVTERCNFRCLYCADGEGPPRQEHRQLLSFEEIVGVTRAAARLGITKVRITGGEPLMRGNLHQLLLSLRSLGAVEQLAMTTNGSRLARFLPHARLLDSINVSLDTLDPEKFATLTGGGEFHQVWEPLLELCRRGVTQVRLNTVLLREVNVDEVESFAELSMRYPLDVRFIEFMPRGTWDARKLDSFYAPISEALQRVAGMGARELTHLSREHAGPATYYALPGARGRIGFVPAVSSPFCRRCNRIRLTADGQLKACLLCEPHVDVRGILRRAHSETELIEALQTAIMMKPAEHRHERLEAMAAVGG